MMSSPGVSTASTGVTPKKLKKMESYTDYSDAVVSSQASLSTLASKNTSSGALAQALANQTGGNIMGFTYE